MCDECRTSVQARLKKHHQLMSWCGWILFAGCALCALMMFLSRQSGKSEIPLGPLVVIFVGMAGAMIFALLKRRAVPSALAKLIGRVCMIEPAPERN
jgi:hypothetical protein